MPNEQNNQATLYFKTGWTGWDTNITPRTGWVVGWLKREQQTCSFALNMEPKTKEQLSLRLQIAKQALHILNVF